MALYKTRVVIWSEFDPRTTELSVLAREAESGEAYCSSMETASIDKPEEDGDWDGNEFFSCLDADKE